MLFPAVVWPNFKQTAGIIGLKAENGNHKMDSKAVLIHSFSIVNGNIFEKL